MPCDHLEECHSVCRLYVSSVMSVPIKVDSVLSPIYCHVRTVLSRIESFYWASSGIVFSCPSDDG